MGTSGAVFMQFFLYSTEFTEKRNWDIMERNLTGPRAKKGAGQVNCGQREQPEAALVFTGVEHEFTGKKSAEDEGFFRGRNQESD